MAAVSVVFDGTRANEAEATTNWTAATATVTVEPDFVYQNTNSISAQVKTTRSGFYFRNSAVNYDFSTSPGRVWLAKVIATNKNALDGNGLELEIGNGARTNYYGYYVFTALTYPIAGGWQIVPIDPNLSEYRSATTGTPNLAVVDMFGVQADFNATSRAQNVALDAIDHFAVGSGLTLTGGDGADADGTFTSFVTTDEGTSTNRWGIVATRDGILYVNGTLTIGSATATVFTDSNRVLVFPDGRFGVGFQGIKFSLANASSQFTVTSCVFNGRGVQKTNDTRPDYTVTSTTGLASSFNSCTFNTFRNITFTSKVTADGCSFLNGLLLTQASSTLSNCSFSGQTTGAGVGHVLADDLDLISSCSFTAGSTGHAIECRTPGTYSLSACSFTSYGADDTTNAAFYNNCTVTTLASYAETNQDSTSSLRSGADTALGQSFASGAGGVLSACRFYLKKTGTPTGNATAKIYAHSGSFGTSSVPTGAALATSETFDVSTLTGSYALTEFKFEGTDAITLTASTNYVLVIEYTGGSVGNTLDVGTDTSAPGHGGNASTYNGSWTAASGTDACFYLYTGGAIIINVTDGGDSPTVRNALGCSTEVNNAVTLTVTVVDATTGSAIENAQVAIYRTSDNTELMNEDTNASGIATEGFNYVSSTAIYYRIRKSSTGAQKYKAFESTGTITGSGFSVSIRLERDTIASA